MPLPVTQKKASSLSVGLLTTEWNGSNDIIMNKKNGTSRKGAKPPRVSSGLRALIVDDEKIMLTIGGNMLENLGFQVDAAGCGDDALLCLKKRRYDLVLTDLVMSGIDGIELSRRIRQVSSGTKIIIMTGAQFGKDLDKKTSMVADRWLFKPFGFPQLEETVSCFFPDAFSDP